jgi:hypothetical protein
VLPRGQRFVARALLAAGAQIAIPNANSLIPATAAQDDGNPQLETYLASIHQSIVRRPDLAQLIVKHFPAIAPEAAEHSTARRKSKPKSKLERDRSPEHVTSHEPGISSESADSPEVDKCPSLRLGVTSNLMQDSRQKRMTILAVPMMRGSQRFAAVSTTSSRNS